LSPTPTPSATKTPGNTKDDPKPAVEENIQVEYSSDTAQLEVGVKKTHKLRSVKVNSDNLEYLIIQYLFGPCKSHKGNFSVHDCSPFYLFTPDVDTLQGSIIKDSMLTKITFIFLLLLVTVLAVNRQFRGACNVLIQ
jgi:hypothetical protein